MSGPAIAYLDMDVRSSESPLSYPGLASRLTAVDCYDVGAADGVAMEDFAGVVVPAGIDQEHLLVHRAVIRAYLDAGGVVVFGGHLFRPWLPGASTFVPLEPASRAGYEVAFVADHPVFQGVDAADLTYRRGVAGFFARGHHPPPEGAEILVRLSGGQPTTYVDRATTAGTIFVQATCDLLGYAGGLDTTAARLPDQLLDWVAMESCRRRGNIVGGSR